MGGAMGAGAPMPRWSWSALARRVFARVAAEDREDVRHGRVRSGRRAARIVAWTAVVLLSVSMVFLDGRMAVLLRHTAGGHDVGLITALRAMLVLLSSAYLWRTRPRESGAPVVGAGERWLDLAYLATLLVGMAGMNAFMWLTKPDIVPFLVAVFMVTSFFWLHPGEALLVFAPGFALLGAFIAAQPASSFVTVADAANLASSFAVALVVSFSLNATRARAAAQRLVIERQGAELSALSARLLHANDLLERLAGSDALTGIANRRAFDEALLREDRRSSREGTPLAVIMADLDWFKAFNDTYGHPAGDGCLSAVAAAIVASIRRPGDVAARYGGEEFAVILPGTDADGAFAVAEAIRAAVRAAAILHEGSPLGVVTVSLGVAVRKGGDGTASEAVVAAADRALYAAKDAGRDRVVLSEADADAGLHAGRVEAALSE